MTNWKRFILSLISGIMLYLAWPPTNATILIFVSFVPLLIIDKTTKKTGLFLLYILIAFIIWNFLSLYWLINSTVGGGIFAIIFNGCIMCIPFALYRVVKTKLRSNIGFLALLSLWLSMEFLHNHWEFNFPWLTLGNAFSSKPSWIQWYSFTGTSGGTLLILLTNLTIFKIIRSQNTPIQHVIILLIITVPVLGSIYFYNSQSTKNNSLKRINVVVVQPNINSYSEKYKTTTKSQVDKLIKISKTEIDSTVSLLLWPESAIPYSRDLSKLNSYAPIKAVQKFLLEYPDISLITGMDTYRTYQKNEKIPNGANKSERNKLYVNKYNSVALLDTSCNIQFRHKSKLVPGVDQIPYGNRIPFLKKLLLNKFGISGAISKSDSIEIFTNKSKEVKIAPLVCYEADFNEFVAEFIKKGANIIAVSANDGWWGKTDVYQHHMYYSALIAIQTRRWVVRSSNSGISMIVDSNGNILDPIDAETSGARKKVVYLNENLTFFVRYGDILSKLAVCIVLLLLLTYISIQLKIKILSQPQTELLKLKKKRALST